MPRTPVSAATGTTAISGELVGGGSRNFSQRLVDLARADPALTCLGVRGDPASRGS